jgi:hypothetical protein
VTDQAAVALALQRFADPTAVELVLGDLWLSSEPAG